MLSTSTQTGLRQGPSSPLIGPYNIVACGDFYKLGSLFVGVLVTAALLIWGLR